jgi:hypothetical protein
LSSPNGAIELDFAGWDSEPNHALSIRLLYIRWFGGLVLGSWLVLRLVRVWFGVNVVPDKRRDLFLRGLLKVRVRVRVMVRVRVRVKGWVRV